MQARGKFESEHITATFTGTRDYLRPTLNDPGHDLVEDVELDSVSILGIDVELKDLPGDLQTEIMNLQYEVEWTSDD